MTLNSSEDSNQSMQGSVNNGLIGRIVENWLTNATERGYQLAFCQMLAAEGEQLLYIASHGPFEKGKDIITRTSDGKVRAYQLKGGDIRLGEWRSIQEQINNLVELPINLPQCPSHSGHEPFFVTNGRVDDVVLDYINTANLGWQERRFIYPLRVVEKSQLVHRFVAAHGAFLPHEATDFQLFLTLLLADGTAPLDKASFSRFLQAVIPFENGGSSKNISRALSSAALLTTYILGVAANCRNNWALFEGWTIMASYALAAATKFSLTDELWTPTFELSMSAANRALDDLADECKERNQFVEGHPLGDGYFYGARQLIMAGLLSAWTLTRRRRSLPPDTQVQKLILNRLREGFIWGESAAPFILVAALELEQQCQQPAAENFVFDYLRILLMCHDEGMRGLPDSFIDVEDSIRFMHKIGEQDIESYQGFSHTCQAAVDFLARRWRRQALARVWEGVTRLSLDSSVPQLGWEWFFWRSDSALLESRIAGQPQSWSMLLQEVANRDISRLPPLLTKHANFAIFWILVFPHRLTPETLPLIEGHKGD